MSRPVIMLIAVTAALSGCAKPAPDLSPMPTIFVKTATPLYTPTEGSPIRTVTPFSPTAAIMPPPVTPTTTAFPGGASQPPPVPTNVPTAPGTQPVIHSFTVTPTENVHQGSTVTAAWSAEGPLIRLCITNIDYYGGKCSEVRSSGSHSLTIDWPDGTAIVTLGVQVGPEAPPTVSSAVPIDLGCPNTWAFDLEVDARCPGPVQTFIGASAQPFEHGWMIYTGTGYIALLDAPMQNYPGGHQIGYVLDPLNIAGDTSSQVGTPPSGHYAPTSGFGILWRGDVSDSAGGYRQWLGWATQPEFNYDATEQCWVLKGYTSAMGGISHCYLTHPSGGVIDLTTDNMWQYWKMLGQ